MRIVEGAAAASHTKAPVFKVENIAPWIPPSCRSKTVVNSEVQKGTLIVQYTISSQQNT